MKITQISTLVLGLAALMGAATLRAQDIAAEVPGDNFSLEGALELFKRSESPEEFEQLLNDPDATVNNLDLNGDGYIDYVRVFDRNEGNVHAFIIQAVISEDDFQDVAVIELEKLSNGKAVLQIIGDEDIYGVETIIEPTREVRTYAGAASSRTVVNVWNWPSVRYVYSPHYSVWISPWRWHVHPTWWRPWRPVTYAWYHDHWRPYRPYYSVSHVHRVAYARQLYRPYRTTSIVVRDRHHSQISRYRSSYPDGHRGGRISSNRSSYGQHRDMRGQTSRRPSSGITQREALPQRRRESTEMNRRSHADVRNQRSPSAERRAGDFSGRDYDRSKRQSSPAGSTTPGGAIHPDRPVQRPATRRQTVPANVQRGNNGAGDSYSAQRPPAIERESVRRQPATRQPGFSQQPGRSRQPQMTAPRGAGRQPQMTSPPAPRRNASPGISRGRSSQAPNYQRQSSRTDALRSGGRGRD